MTDNRALVHLMRAIAAGERDDVSGLLAATPELALIGLAKGSDAPHSDEFFLDTCGAQIYLGHTALHVAARAYDVEIASWLLEVGADIGAKDRRGAEPLHAAAGGGPGSALWNADAQVAMIAWLIERGADVEAVAEGGVTPLQRAVRNRCSAAVRALLDAGADPRRTNRNGSSASTLATWTTGRGGSGSDDAKREQAAIVQMLQPGLP